jgi:formylglycine-generating enzyme required for sulfatase activity
MSKQCLTCKHENSDTATICETCLALLKSSAATTAIELGDIETFSIKKGDLIAGRYQIIKEISYGVLGILYQVKDTHFREQYLHLKMLNPRWSSDPLERKRFFDEINICINPVNPPRIQVDHLENGQSIYFYLTGPSLQDYIDERKGKIPPFSLSEIRTVILALLDILDYAHQYTVHNQISPSTIIVIGSFPDVSIRLLDYGLGDDVSGSHTKSTTPDTGSYIYKAPEHVRTPLETDLRADLYSVGVILYQMLTGGEAVGVFEMPSEICSHTYGPLDSVIKKVLSPKADLRYSTAMVFSNSIADALNKIEQTHDEMGSGMTGSTNEDHKTAQDSMVEQHHINHTSDKLPAKKVEKINTLPGKLGLLQESRIFLLAFVAALLLLGGGVYVLLNSDGTSLNDPMASMATDRQGSVNPIEPIDTRNNGIQDSLVSRELNPAISSETDKKLPTPRTPEIPVGHLTIYPLPADAIIRILNIKPPYEPDMALAPGRYQIEVSAQNYESLTQWVEIPADEDLNIEITLKKEEEKIPVITTGHLTISPSPAEANIRILNIKPQYKPNMILNTGRYQIEVSASGYESLTKWVDLYAEDTLDIVIKLDKKETKEKGVFIDPETGMAFKYVTGGCYSMGQSPAGKTELIRARGLEKYQKAYSDEAPQHEVCVDGFYMGKYEVTVTQWNTFIQESNYQTDAEKNAGNKTGCYSLKNNKWAYAKGRYWNNLGFPQSSNSPVACVSHSDVTQYINWLNQKSSKQYRLPTEAEWEYAARGGTRSSRFWGNTVDKSACQYANVAYSKRSRNNYFPCDDGHKWSSPVGSFSANNYGMYDMLGNMWEWCSDKYESNYYLNSPRNNPPGASSGQLYAIRGGSWNGRSSDVRAANRNWAEHNTRKSNVGFRLVTQTTGE